MLKFKASVGVVLMQSLDDPGKFDKVPIPGYRCFGLFIHHPYSRRQDSFGKGWKITHLKSGYAIADNFDTLKEAKAIATKLLVIDSWLDDVDGLSKETKDKAFELLKSEGC